MGIAGDIRDLNQLICMSRSDDETKGARESLNRSELVEELYPFLRKLVEPVVPFSDFPYHAKRLELIQMFHQSVIGQVRTIQYASRLRMILLTLNDSHNVNIDSHL